MVKTQVGIACFPILFPQELLRIVSAKVLRSEHPWEAQGTAKRLCLVGTRVRERGGGDAFCVALRTTGRTWHFPSEVDTPGPLRMGGTGLDNGLKEFPMVPMTGTFQRESEEVS